MPSITEDNVPRIHQEYLKPESLLWRKESASLEEEETPVKGMVSKLKQQFHQPTPIPVNTVSRVKKELHQPPLTELEMVLSSWLGCYFGKVDVSRVQCPDLTKAPFNLASSGICGNESIVDLGGVKNLLPTVNRDKVYDVKTLPKVLGMEQVSVVGAGAGPWPVKGTNMELVANMVLDSERGVVRNDSVIAYVDKTTGGYHTENLNLKESRVGLLQNYLCSEGKREEVLRVNLRKRINDKDPITTIRECLEQHYPEQNVALGGVMLLEHAKAKMFVMPDFSSKPLNTPQEVDEWLRYYTMKGPLCCIGYLVNNHMGIDLRPDHFHGFNLTGSAGHYHNDVAPDTVEYTCYFTVPKHVYKLD